MNFSFSDFLSFDKMVTPFIIQILYWILIVLVLLVGLVMIGGAMVAGEFLGVIAGIVYLALAPIAVRIWCELVILGFRVYKVLCDIRDQRAS